jgi:hypothetical protein
MKDLTHEQRLNRREGGKHMKRAKDLPQYPIASYIQSTSTRQTDRCLEQMGKDRGALRCLRHQCGMCAIYAQAVDKDASSLLCAGGFPGSR